MIFALINYDTREQQQQLCRVNLIVFVWVELAHAFLAACSPHVQIESVGRMQNGRHFSPIVVVQAATVLQMIVHNGTAQERLQMCVMAQMDMDLRIDHPSTDFYPQFNSLNRCPKTHRFWLIPVAGVLNALLLTFRRRSAENLGERLGIVKRMAFHLLEAPTICGGCAANNNKLGRKMEFVHTAKANHTCMHRKWHFLILEE